MFLFFVLIFFIQKIRIVVTFKKLTLKHMASQCDLFGAVKLITLTESTLYILFWTWSNDKIINDHTKQPPLF